MYFSPSYSASLSLSLSFSLSLSLSLSQVEEKLNQLKKEYDEKLAQKEELKQKAELLELKLDRAAKVVSGLAGERTRWEESVKVWRERERERERERTYKPR